MELKILLRALRLGIVLSVGSSFTGTVASIVSGNTKDTPVGQIIFFSHVVLTIVAFIVCLIHKKKICSKESLFALFDITLFSLPKMYFSYEVVRLLPSRNVPLISFCSIFLTIILSRLVLNESFIIWKLTASTVLIISAFLFTCKFDITQIKLNEGITQVTIYQIFSVLCNAVRFIKLKKITKLHYSIILLVHGVTGIILSSFSYFVERWTFNDLKELLATSVFIPLEETCFILALITEQVGLVSIVHALNVIFVYIWELFSSKEAYTHTKTIGSLLVLLSVIFCAYLPHDEDNNNEDDTKCNEDNEDSPLQSPNKPSEV